VFATPPHVALLLNPLLGRSLRTARAPFERNPEYPIINGLAVLSTGWSLLVEDVSFIRSSFEVENCG